MQPAPNRASINDAARARRVKDEALLVALVLVLARYRAGEVDEDGHEDQLDERDSRAGRNTRSVLLAASTARVTVLPRSLNMLSLLPGDRRRPESSWSRASPNRLIMSVPSFEWAGVGDQVEFISFRAEKQP